MVLPYTRETQKISPRLFFQKRTVTEPRGAAPPGSLAHAKYGGASSPNSCLVVRLLQGNAFLCESRKCLILLSASIVGKHEKRMSAPSHQHDCTVFFRLCSCHAGAMDCMCVPMRPPCVPRHSACALPCILLRSHAFSCALTPIHFDWPPYARETRKK